MSVKLFQREKKKDVSEQIHMNYIYLSFSNAVTEI